MIAATADGQQTAFDELWEEEQRRSLSAWCTSRGSARPVLPFSPESILALSTSFKAGWYKSFPAYMSRVKDTHIRDDQWHKGHHLDPPGSGYRAPERPVRNGTRQSRALVASGASQGPARLDPLSRCGCFRLSCERLKSLSLLPVPSSLPLLVSKKDTRAVGCIHTLCCSRRNDEEIASTCPVFISATRWRTFGHSSLRAWDEQWTRLWSNSSSTR